MTHDEEQKLYAKRQQEKEQRAAYREKARDLCGQLDDIEFSIEPHANVQVTERGA